MEINTSENNALFWCTEHQPIFQANAAFKAFESEASKGCTGDIYPYPLKSIVPQFDPFSYRNNSYEDPLKIMPPQKLEHNLKFVRIIPCFHEDDGKLWQKGVFEFLSHVHSSSSYFLYEIIATLKIIRIQFSVLKTDQKLFEDVLKSKFPNAQFVIIEETKQEAPLKDPYINALIPNPPYHRNLHFPDTNPLHTLFQSLASLQQDEMFYYRAIIEPAQDSLDRNCLALYTYERKAFAFHEDVATSSKHFFPPSAEAKKAIDDKIHPDNMPMFFVQPLIAFWGSKDTFLSVTAFKDRYLFGQDKYKIIDEQEFFSKLGKEKTIEFLKNKTSHVQGHLLNRLEAASLIPFPCEACISNRAFKLSRVSGKPVPSYLQGAGIPLGIQELFEKKVELKFPLNCLEQSMAIIGNTGFGKTNLLLNILASLCQSASPRYSVVIVYFHDFDFIIQFISKIPPDRLNDVVLAMPFLNGMVLGWNLVHCDAKADAAKRSDDLSYAIENSSAKFGVDVQFRMKSLLQTLMLSENSSLDHALMVLDRENPIGKAKRNEARRKTNNPLLLKFLQDIEGKSHEGTSLANKLQPYFDNKKIAGMSSYNGKTLFSSKEIVEKGKILIYYLGGLGSAGNAIASAIVSQLHQHFQDYGNSYPKPCFPTVIAIDEAQRMRAKGIMDSIREDRKYGLSYILSTQSLEGLEPNLREAINLISSSCFFQCPEQDARHFSQLTSGQISIKDIMALDKYEMFVRILSSQNVFKCKTTKFEPEENNNIKKVIQNCLSKYYVHPKSIADARTESEKKLLQGGRPAKQGPRLELPEAMRIKFNL